MRKKTWQHFLFRQFKKLQVAMATASEFFSSPGNLKDITPDNLGFQIISKHHGSSIFDGQIIEYTVKPLLGIPLYGMTEITQVEDHEYFIDWQRFGPYSLWSTSIISNTLKAV